ncbi:MAG TPA: Do family serine endopeptidase [Bryobacteraceae bacterium]|nr:Do family serine endopeptidase [Bryobacteraceae bacterium]
MRFFDKMRQQKLLSLSLLMFTLAIGIVIGTLVNTGVKAARGQNVAPDASPLSIPNPVVLGNEFTKLAKKLEPSVVYITADYTPKIAENPHGRGKSQDDESDDSGSNGLDPFFRRFFKNSPNLPPHAFKQEQSGTGFIVDKNGYIITNNHVVSKVDHIKVKLHGSDHEYRARIIGTDPETDLAVIKIDPKESLVPVTVGNSDAIQVGDWSVAIGSPFGLEASVTAGIVSALGRDIAGPTTQLQRFIQTDAAINPGNSGGPLLNIRGEVIGVNTMIATQNGGYQGIGFALPINMVARVYNDLIRAGKVTRGSIGIKWTKGAKPDLMKALGTNAGVLVEEVHKGGPADKAGLKQDDVIVSIDGKPVKDGDELVARVADTPINTPVHLGVDRNGKKMDFKVTIEDRAEVFKDDPTFSAAEPQPQEEEPTRPDIAPSTAKFGIKIKTLSDPERDNMGLHDKRGVQVSAVLEGSFAEDIGILERDVIVSINRQAVTSVEDIQRIQSTLKPGDAVAIRIMRSPDVQGRARVWNSFVVSGTLPVQ